MILNKEDSEIRQLVLDSVEYGREIGLHEDKLRCIRAILFDKLPTLTAIKVIFMANCLSGLSVEPTLDWLIANGLVMKKADKTYRMTPAYVEFAIELRPELA